MRRKTCKSHILFYQLYNPTSSSSFCINILSLFLKHTLLVLDKEKSDFEMKKNEKKLDLKVDVEG
jgi:hypothetical protein